MKAIAVPQLPPLAERLPGQPWSLEDAGRFLSVSARTMTRLTASGKLRTIKVLGRVLIPDDELRRVARDGIPMTRLKTKSA